MRIFSMKANRIIKKGLTAYVSSPCLEECIIKFRSRDYGPFEKESKEFYSTVTTSCLGRTNIVENKY